MEWTSGQDISVGSVDSGWDVRRQVQLFLAQRITEVCVDHG